jgi:hypothetical protein
MFVEPQFGHRFGINFPITQPHLVLFAKSCFSRIQKRFHSLFLTLPPTLRPLKPLSQLRYKLLLADVRLLSFDARIADAHAKVSHVHANGNFLLGLQTPQPLPILIHAAHCTLNTIIMHAALIKLFNKPPGCYIAFQALAELTFQQLELAFQCAA